MPEEKHKEQIFSNILIACMNMGNPFIDNCPELLVLDSRNCAADSVDTTMQTIQSIGNTKLMCL